VETALALVEAEGFAAFSTRRLGEVLGCEAMSIYHYFPGKQHLLDAMVDEVIARMEWPHDGVEPVARLRAIAHAYRSLAHRHARFFPYAAVHRLNTPTGVRFIERVLAAFGAVAPDRERAARGFRAIGYYLVGAVIDETAGYAAGPSAAQPVDDAYIVEHCPNLRAAAPYFASGQWDRTFEMGLDALVDALKKPD
jgi:AcrR family transcriptional regulator